MHTLTPNALPTLPDDALEQFYAQALERMVRDELRPGISRAQPSAKIPLHKQAMNAQMGRTGNDAQAKDLALAMQDAMGIRWEGVRYGSTVQVRKDHWMAIGQRLVSIRGHLHDAKSGPAPVNPQTLLTLVDKWHNVPILIAQRGVQAVDPARVSPVLVEQLKRYAQAHTINEQAQLAATIDTVVPGPEPRRPRL